MVGNDHRNCEMTHLLFSSVHQMGCVKVNKDSTIRSSSSLFEAFSAFVDGRIKLFTSEVTTSTSLDVGDVIVFGVILAFFDVLFQCLLF